MTAEHVALGNIEDTIANHGEITSGNTIPVCTLPPIKEERESDLAAPTRVETQELTLSSELSDKIDKTHEKLEGPTWEPPAPQPLPDINTLIAQETKMLDVFSDNTRPALLAILHHFDPLTIEQILRSTDIPRSDLLFYIESLKDNKLISSRLGRYRVSARGIQLLQSLGLLEETE